MPTHKSRVSVDTRVIYSLWQPLLLTGLSSTYRSDGQYCIRNVIGGDGRVRFQPVAGGPSRGHVRRHRRGERGRARRRRLQEEPAGRALQPLHCFHG